MGKRAYLTKKDAETRRNVDGVLSTAVYTFFTIPENISYLPKQNVILRQKM